MSLTVITNEGLNKVASGAHGPYFSLKYFVPVYDNRIDPEIHTGVGSVSADSLEGSASETDIFATLVGEKIFNVDPSEGYYTLTPDYKFIFKETNPPNRTNTSVGLDSVDNTTQNSASRINRYSEVSEDITKPLTESYTGTSISGTDGNWSITNIETLEAFSGISFDRNVLFDAISYSSERGEDDIVQCVVNCRATASGNTSYKFNKLAIFIQELNADGTVNASEDPVLFATTILNNTVYLTSTSSGFTAMNIQVKLKFQKNTGSVMFFNEDYWVRTNNNDSLYYPYKVSVGDEGLNGSHIPKGTLEVFSEDGKNIAISRGSQTYFEEVDDFGNILRYHEGTSKIVASGKNNNLNSLGTSIYVEGDGNSTSGTNTDGYILSKNSNLNNTSHSGIFGGTNNTIRDNTFSKIDASAFSDIVTSGSGTGSYNEITNSDQSSITNSNYTSIEGASNSSVVGGIRTKIANSNNVSSQDNALESDTITANFVETSSDVGLQNTRRTSVIGSYGVNVSNGNRISVVGSGEVSSTHTGDALNHQGLFFGGARDITEESSTFSAVLGGVGNGLKKTLYGNILGSVSCNINDSRYSSITSSSNSKIEGTPFLTSDGTTIQGSSNCEIKLSGLSSILASGFSKISSGAFITYDFVIGGTGHEVLNSFKSGSIGTTNKVSNSDESYAIGGNNLVLPVGIAGSKNMAIGFNVNCYGDNGFGLGFDGRVGGVKNILISNGKGAITNVSESVAIVAQDSYNEWNVGLLNTARYKNTNRSVILAGKQINAAADEIVIGAENDVKLFGRNIELNGTVKMGYAPSYGRDYDVTLQGTVTPVNSAPFEIEVGGISQPNGARIGTLGFSGVIYLSTFVIDADNGHYQRTYSRYNVSYSSPITFLLSLSDYSDIEQVGAIHQDSNTSISPGNNPRLVLDTTPSNRHKLRLKFGTSSIPALYEGKFVSYSIRIIGTQI